MVQVALLGGLFIGILSALPIINVANCCCLWIIGGGMLAAYLDSQNDPRPMTVGRGAFAGLTAGIAGAFVWLIVSLALDPFVSPFQQRIVEAMLRNASDMPPEAREALENVGTRASSSFRFVLGFIFHLLIGVVFATLGGALGAMFVSRKDVPPALGGDPWTGPPPPLPPT